MRYDPMTGKPVIEDEEIRFDPMTGEPIRQKNKKVNIPPKLAIKIAAAVAAVAIAAALIVVLAGAFSGRQGKVLAAAANTVKDSPHIVKALKPLNLLRENKFTLALSCDMAGSSIDGEFRNSTNEKQVEAELGYNGENFSFLAGIDNKTVKVQAPALADYVFVYSYNGKATGYLPEELGASSMVNLNTSLKSVMKREDLYSGLYKILRNELKNVQFTNAKKKKYTVDGKDVDCKGYTAVVTGRNLIHVADELEELMMDYVEKTVTSHTDKMDLVTFWRERLASELSYIRKEAEDMPDIEVTFYVHKKKLAAVVGEYMGEKIELCFEGGDYRMQNMTLKVEDFRLKVIGSREGTTEQFTVEIREKGTLEEEPLQLEYDYKSGEFELDLFGMVMEGELNSSKSQLNLKIDKIKEDGFSISPKLDITLKKGAHMEKFSGKQFDLGNADRDACEELAEDIEDKLYGGKYEWLVELLEEVADDYRWNW